MTNYYINKNCNPAKHIMKKITWFGLILILIACDPVENSTIDSLYEIDREFSARSAETGYDKAFVEFAHPEAVLLRENQLPIIGKESIRELFEESSAPGITLTWEPLGGNIAGSGDLGYTYGVFEIKNDSLIETGTYVSIWKKDPEGEWKYILDSGNEGTGE